MGDNGGTPNNLDFQVDKKNLYREESVTDLKIATIRQLIPVNIDGTSDTSREVIFLGNTQLGTPQGPIPLQAKLEANTLEQAMDLFPQAMELETKKVIENFKRMEAQQKKQKSNLIIPGMN
ncbi:MAG: cytoplasmic protein [Proteobacteria bacterium]|nr:cytoplasmic protein [Desulfobacula sp.]MBU3952200.1 cytoplasmic protein [Pseudomonadota bacterium]MBU4130704.1 cytoplasmic protein [Pseudomonadota bacterium]